MAAGADGLRNHGDAVCVDAQQPDRVRHDENRGEYRHQQQAAVGELAPGFRHARERQQQACQKQRIAELGHEAEAGRAPSNAALRHDGRSR